MTEELQQALDALKECRAALQAILDETGDKRPYSTYSYLPTQFIDAARSAKLRAELVLSLHREAA